MKKYENQNIPESTQADTVNPEYSSAIQEFAAACTVLREKKEKVCAEFVKARDAFNSGDTEHMKLPASNPLDLAQIDDVILKTGSPAEVKRFVALAQSLSAPIAQDVGFFAAVVRVVAAVGPYAVAEERRLSEKLAAAEAEKEEAVRRAEDKVVSARGSLLAFRRRIYDDIIRPTMDLDRLFVDYCPSVFCGDVGYRMSAVCDGTMYATGEQLDSLLRQFEIDSGRNKKVIF